MSIKKHEICISILQGVSEFEERKKMITESFYGFSSSFPELKEKYLRDIEIHDKCIERLKQRYNKALTELTK